jgi:serine/threonine protein kinase
MNHVIQGKYEIQNILGKGKFGTVCKGTIKKNNQFIAIKLEPKQNSISTLRHEAAVLRYLNSKRVVQIPELYYYGTQQPYYYLIMTYYPEYSLDKYELEADDIHEWWIQSCCILRAVHDQGIIHRDIKPSHFMKSMKGNDVQWNLIDFGLATTYLDDQHEHVKESQNTNLIGSPNWISLYIHQGIQPSRRDDYISIVYILIDLYLQMEGKNLPWLDVDINRIYDYKHWDCLKQNTIVSPSLFEEKEFIDKLIFVCERLQYGEKPPYDAVWLNL